MPPHLGCYPLTPRRAAALLLAGTALLFGLKLGNLDLWAPDEPRYGAIAEELRSFRHGAEGLVLLHLNDTAYTQKPPLYFWLAAAAGVPGGRVTEWAARLPSAIAGLGCVALTAFIGRRLLGNPMLALLATGMLATSFRFAFTARRAQLDVLLTAFELVAIAIFIATEFRDNLRPDSPRTSWTQTRTESPRDGIMADTPGPSSLTIVAFHSALGAAALVKGPVGWLPLLVIAAYLAWEGRLGHFRKFLPAWAWSFSILPVCLWMAGAVALAPKGFAEIALIENLIGRFFSGSSHARPFYYFLYQTPADFLPWTLLLPFGLPFVLSQARSLHHSHQPIATPAGAVSASRFLIVWIALPLLFFTLSAGKRGVYMLPVFPALALVAASAIRPRGAHAADGLKRMHRAGIAVGVVIGIETALFAFAAPLLEAEKSPRPIAQAVALRTRPDESVGVYRLRPIEGAIPYYGDRSVVSLKDDADLEAFFEANGRLLLMREGHFNQIQQAHGLSVVEAFRSNRRRLVLAELESDIFPRGKDSAIDPGRQANSLDP